MVVFKIDIQSAFARPAESDPVIPSHAHRPAFRPALQAVEAKACNVPILRLLRHFQQLQDALALPDMIGADPARLAGAVDLFKPLVPEAAVHYRFIRPTRKRTIESTMLIRMELASGK
jgi:hypothetical protein